MAKDFNQLVAELGRLREQARRLADEDYVSAKYKGYSADGMTLVEVMAALADTEAAIERRERQLAALADE